MTFELDNSEEEPVGDDDVELFLALLEQTLADYVGIYAYDVICDVDFITIG